MIDDQDESENEFQVPHRLSFWIRVTEGERVRVSGQVQFPFQVSRSGSGVEEMILERIGPSD